MSIVLRWSLVVVICYGVLVAMGGFIGTFVGYSFSQAAINIAVMGAFLAYLPASMMLGGFLYVMSIEDKLVMPVMSAVSGNLYYNDPMDGPLSVFRAILAGCAFMALPTLFFDASLFLDGVPTLPAGVIFFGGVGTLLVIELVGRLCLRILRVDVSS